MNERVWSISGLKLTGKTEVTGEKPVPVPSSLPQTPYGMFWNKIRTLWRKDGQLFYRIFNSTCFDFQLIHQGRQFLLL